jgi:hypothetical protein
MSEDKFSLHVDSDWKKQAQEEKRKLAEAEEKRKAAMPPPAPAGVVTTAPPSGAPTARGAAPGERRDGKEMPPASIGTLVQSTLTQVLLYLGELAVRGGQSMLNLDMAKHHVDTLGVLAEKTKGNLSPDEQSLMDTAVYEAQMRFIRVASEYAELP